MSFGCMNVNVLNTYTHRGQKDARCPEHGLMVMIPTMWMLGTDPGSVRGQQVLLTLTHPCRCHPTPIFETRFSCAALAFMELIL